MQHGFNYFTGICLEVSFLPLLRDELFKISMTSKPIGKLSIIMTIYKFCGYMSKIGTKIVVKLSWLMTSLWVNFKSWLFLLFYMTMNEITKKGLETNLRTIYCFTF